MLGGFSANIEVVIVANIKCITWLLHLLTTTFPQLLNEVLHIDFLGCMFLCVAVIKNILSNKYTV